MDSIKLTVWLADVIISHNKKQPLLYIDWAVIKLCGSRVMTIHLNQVIAIYI